MPSPAEAFHPPTADPAFQIQEALGIDELAAQDYLQVVIACPAAENSDRQTTLGEFMSTPHGQFIGGRLLEAAKGARQQGLPPEAALTQALGPAAIRHQETGQLQRLPAEIPDSPKPITAVLRAEQPAVAAAEVSQPPRPASAPLAPRPEPMPELFMLALQQQQEASPAPVANAQKAAANIALPAAVDRSEPFRAETPAETAAAVRRPAMVTAHSPLRPHPQPAELPALPTPSGRRSSQEIFLAAVTPEVVDLPLTLPPANGTELHAVPEAPTVVGTELDAGVDVPAAGEQADDRVPSPPIYRPPSELAAIPAQVPLTLETLQAAYPLMPSSWEALSAPKDEQPPEQTFVQLAECLAAHAETIPTPIQEILQTVRSLLPEGQTLEAGQLQLSAEVTDQVLLLFAALGYRNPAEILHRYTETHGQESLLRIIDSLCRIKSPVHEDVWHEFLLVSQGTTDDPISSTWQHIGRTLLQVIGKRLPVAV